jgi:cyclopropane fatty-acyl-phospholipid synthase-like methyltransferase
MERQIVIPDQKDNMESRDNQVRHFFNQTDLYLKNRYAIQARVEIVQELLGNVQQAKILDIGCGDGSLSRPFLGKGNQLFFLDISENMLQVAQHNVPPEFRDQVTYVNMDFLAFHPTHTFDVILCVGVLAHVREADRAIPKVSQLLSPMGRCILQFTDHTQLIGKAQLASYNLRRKFSGSDAYPVSALSSASVNDQIGRSNLHVERQIQYSILLPGMGRLPQSLLYRWLMLSLRIPILARFGSEKILLLVKDKDVYA